MKFKRFITPARVALITIFIIGMGIMACSKSGSSGYGNNGGNGSGNTVSIKNFAFSVASLSVANGTTVTWTNNDATAHTVTVDDASFDSGNIAPGATFSHKFTAAGTVAYDCSIHTTMKANVVVAN
ncbi:MAG: cupredoxin domain-containing protein [Parafilimonas sp.]|nr:cupredoxin domain-containing protein [Parafilimonas sp.]